MNHKPERCQGITFRQVMDPGRKHAPVATGEDVSTWTEKVFE